MNHLDQARFMWKWANQRGSEGVHSFELRERKVLNPSQRSKDVADHVAFWTMRDGRGSRYFVDGHQPTGAHRVVPNHGADVGGEVESPASSPGASPAADVSAEALVLDFTGEAVRGAEVLPFGTRVYTRRAA